MSPRTTASERAIIARLYALGLPVAEIQTRTGRSLDTIYRCIRGAKVHTRYQWPVRYSEKRAFARCWAEALAEGLPREQRRAALRLLEA